MGINRLFFARRMFDKGNIITLLMYPCESGDIETDLIEGRPRLFIPGLRSKGSFSFTHREGSREVDYVGITKVKDVSTIAGMLYNEVLDNGYLKDAKKFIEDIYTNPVRTRIEMPDSREVIEAELTEEGNLYMLNNVIFTFCERVPGVPKDIEEALLDYNRFSFFRQGFLSKDLPITESKPRYGYEDIAVQFLGEHYGPKFAKELRANNNVVSINNGGNGRNRKTGSHKQ